MQVETSTVFAKGTRPKRTGVLQIDDRVLEASARQLAILECLHENLGTVVSYARLCSILGLTSDERKHLHLLRQYVKFNSDMLEANRLPYVITVAREAGYALCRICRDQRQRSIHIKTQRSMTRWGRPGRIHRRPYER
jgi:DNA-binding winged helix-turn-helix (wHTH) protein